MLGWDLDCWRWVDGFFFLKYTMKFGRDSIISMIPDTTRAAVKWQGYFLGNYWFFIGHKFGILCTLAKRPFLCGSFGARQLLLMSGERASLQPPSPSSVFFCLLNISESIKHKFWENFRAQRTRRWVAIIMHKLSDLIPLNL